MTPADRAGALRRYTRVRADFPGDRTIRPPRRAPGVIDDQVLVVFERSDINRPIVDPAAG
jgi:hypothetical protein